MFGVAQRRSFGVDLTLLFSNVGGAQHRQTFGIGGHDPVLDAVVNHLDEVASAVGAAVQVALFRSAFGLVETWCARNVAHAGRERGEDGIESLDDFFFAANHHAIAAFQAPNAAAGTYVNVMETLGRQFLGAANVVNVVRIAAVDEDVAWIEVRQQVGDRLVNHCSWNHQP